MIVDAASVDDIKRAIESSNYVIVDFWAPWCRPCEAVERELDRLVNEMDCGVVVVRVDASRIHDAVVEFGVLGLPTLILYRSGVEIGRISGTVSAEEISKSIGCS